MESKLFIWYSYPMETFVLMILGLFAVLLVLAVLVYPALLLCGAVWSVLSGVRRGLSTRHPSA